MKMTTADEGQHTPSRVHRGGLPSHSALDGSHGHRSSQGRGCEKVGRDLVVEKYRRNDWGLNPPSPWFPHLEKQPCGLETIAVSRPESKAQARAGNSPTVLRLPYKVAQSFPRSLEAGGLKSGEGPLCTVSSHALRRSPVSLLLRLPILSGQGPTL